MFIAINNADLSKVTHLMNCGVNPNTRRWLSDFPTLVKATDYANSETKDDCFKIRLQIIELLLQAGAKINESVFVQLGDNSWTVLYKVIASHNPHPQIVNLLLEYGATVTDTILNKIKVKNNSSELEQLFSHHQKKINLAQNNPTRDLLLESIALNKPYIIKLVVKTKPKLVNVSDIEFAKAESPFSVKILKQALGIRKLRKLATEECSELSKLPNELIQKIEKIVAHQH